MKQMKVVVVKEDSRSFHSTMSLNLWHFLSWMEPLQAEFNPELSFKRAPPVQWLCLRSTNLGKDARICRQASFGTPDNTSPFLFKDSDMCLVLLFWGSIQTYTENNKKHQIIQEERHNLNDFTLTNPNQLTLCSIAPGSGCRSILIWVVWKVQEKKVPPKLQHSGRKPGWEMCFYRSQFFVTWVNTATLTFKGSLEAKGALDRALNPDLSPLSSSSWIIKKPTMAKCPVRFPANESISNDLLSSWPWHQ